LAEVVPGKQPGGQRDAEERPLHAGGSERTPEVRLRLAVPAGPMKDAQGRDDEGRLRVLLLEQLAVAERALRQIRRARRRPATQQAMGEHGEGGPLGNGIASHIAGDSLQALQPPRIGCVDTELGIARQLRLEQQLELGVARDIDDRLLELRARLRNAADPCIGERQGAAAADTLVRVPGRSGRFIEMLDAVGVADQPLVKTELEERLVADRFGWPRSARPRAARLPRRRADDAWSPFGHDRPARGRSSPPWKGTDVADVDHRGGPVDTPSRIKAAKNLGVQLLPEAPTLPLTEATMGGSRRAPQLPRHVPPGDPRHEHVDHGVKRDPVTHARAAGLLRLPARDQPEKTSHSSSRTAHTDPAIDHLHRRAYVTSPRDSPLTARPLLRDLLSLDPA
jgi:hypothetical protein